MNDKKNIDRLFQEKFKDFDVAPNDNVWENIEARLEKKKKKRRVIPIWWQLGGVAAALLLMFAVGSTIFTSDNPDIPTIVDTKDIHSTETNNPVNTNEVKQSTIVTNNSESNTNTSEDLQENDGLYKKANTSKQLLKNNNNANTNVVVNNWNSATNSNTSGLVNNNSNLPTTNSTSSAKNSEENKTSNELEIKSEQEINSLLKSNNTSNAVAKSNDNNVNSETNKTDNSNNKSEESSKANAEDKGQDIEDAIADANTVNEEEEEEEKEIRRWSIAPNIAPVYFNSLGEGSSIDAQFSANNTTSDISMSYGLRGSYAVNKRLKITAGINRVNFNNTTNDVIALSDNSFSSAAAGSNGRFENLQLREDLNASSLTLISRSNINESSASGAVKTIQTGNLEQRFGFIEIPLEIEYRLIDKKFGVNISSGFSTLLLNENEIFADVNGENTLIGEASNINNTSFSANIGIGIDYKLTEKLNINLEPKFKYQLNTFNNTSGDFRPFFIGVYTGLNFKF